MHLGWTPQGPARHIARVLFLLALLSGWLTGVPSWAGVVQEVRVEGDRVVVKFDAPVTQASAFLLSGPQRIALDVAGAEPGRIAVADGVVAKIRQGAQGDGARIVFDLARPAIVIEGSFGKDGRTLTLQLKTVDDERFARAAAERRMSFLPPFTYLQPARRHPYSVSMALPKRMPRAPLPRIYGDASRPLVVIDAGHGGHDPGALSADGGLREKDLTLEVAKAIKDALLASGRVRVALTREDDRFLVLQERYGIARRLKADLFISVHCDSAGNRGGHRRDGLHLLRGRFRQGSRAARGAREQGRHPRRRRSRRRQPRHLVDPDRSHPARDDEHVGELCPIARPRGAAADSDQGQLPPHGIADGAQGARHAVGAVRDRLYLERSPMPRSSPRPTDSARSRRACARRWRSTSPRAWHRADRIVPGSLMRSL
jgi:N-acetylmuramoyl-L-alanine amidase